MLETRLTLFHVLIFGLLQAALWITVDVVRTNQLRHRFDLQLVDRAQAIARAIVQDSGKPAYRPHDAQTLGEILAPHFDEDLLIQVSLSSGVTVKSPGLSGFQFDCEPVESWPQLQGAPTLENVTNPRGQGQASTGHELRMVTLYENAPPGGMMCVGVAASSAPIERFIHTTRTLLLVFIITSLLVSAITSWFLAHRSLSPVGAVVRKARRIGASKLHERIPHPGTDDEIAQMIDVINGMLDRLEAEFKNQQQFISHVSHELRTPLAVILAEVEELRRNGSSPDQLARFARTADEQAQNLLHIVDSFLLLTRARSGARPVVEVPVPVEDIVIEATRRTRATARDHQVKVVPSLDFPVEKPEPVIQGDTDLLYSMLENLVRNAIRHSTPGQQVDIVARTTGNKAVLSVRDRGGGIPADHLEKVFDLFHQVSPESKRSGKLGLGLSIVKAVVKLHGGSVTAINHPEGGAEFTVRLPLDQTSQSANAAP